MVPPDKFGVSVGGDEDSEGPFAMAEGFIIGQGDVLGLAVLNVVVIAREFLDAGQVHAGWRRSLGSRRYVKDQSKA